MFDSLPVRINLLFVSALILLTFGRLNAQPLGSNSGPKSNRVNSPYSHYGIGDLNSPYNTDFIGMGGAATAQAPSLSVNSYNPASYSLLSAATLDFAFIARQKNVLLDNQKISSGTGNFSYLSIGVDIGKHFGLNLGFKPIANMYYNANDTLNIDGLGKTLKNFNGSGNLQYAYLGLAGRIKGVSIGANFGYVFGNYNYSSSLETPGSDSDGTVHHVRSSQITQSERIGGLYWNAGILYHAAIGKLMYLNLGATATMSQQLHVTQQIYNIGYNYLFSTSGSDLVVDTVLNTLKKGSLTMPTKYSFGAAFGKSTNWQIAADISYSDWTRFEKMGVRTGVGDNAWRGSIGGSYTPKAKTGTKNYFSFVTYRLGAYFGKDYFHLGNTDVHYYGGTIGLSFPLQRRYNNFGKINVALNIGQRGKMTATTAKETYIRFIFGVTLNDSYWLKRPARYQ